MSCLRNGKKRKSAERNARNLQEQLDYARQEQFGDRRQRVRKKRQIGKGCACGTGPSG